MILFRNACFADGVGINRLAELSGSGITTLPKDKDLLEKRLAWSSASFEKNVSFPINEYYLFVLEDTETGCIIGTSAIEANTGHDTPFYSYKITKHTRVCHSLHIRSDYQMLNLVNDNQGHSELCTLFLDPRYRKNNNGPLLSRARFLFMALHATRFAHTIMADMRGVSDDKGVSPFWEHLGRHFFHMAFPEADYHTLSTNKQFIEDLMPSHPVYVDLLDKAAQEVIGKPHPSTVPAMNILLREGFHYANYIDIFDAGPTLLAEQKNIRTINASRILSLHKSQDETIGPRCLVASTTINVRATLAPALCEEGFVTLSPQTVDLLQLKEGDPVCIAPLQGLS